MVHGIRARLNAFIWGPRRHTNLFQHEYGVIWMLKRHHGPTGKPSQRNTVETRSFGWEWTRLRDQPYFLLESFTAELLFLGNNFFHCPPWFSAFAKIFDRHICTKLRECSYCATTAWKVSKYGVISGPYFPGFGLNTERYSVFSPNAGKYGPEITPYLDTFHAVYMLMRLRWATSVVKWILLPSQSRKNKPSSCSVALQTFSPRILYFLCHKDKDTPAPPQPSVYHLVYYIYFFPFSVVFINARSSHRRYSVRKGVACQRLYFNKVAGLRPATLLK